MADALTEPDPDLWRMRPRATQPGTRLGELADIPDGDAREYVFGRGTTMFSIFVVRQGREVYGYLNICPHYSLPLNHRAGHFMSEDKRYIRCTMHNRPIPDRGWVRRLRRGRKLLARSGTGTCCR